MKERLQKYIANNGVASRRKSEELIFNGHVKVNGKVVMDIVMIDDETDTVEVDGSIIKPVNDKIYLVINKPTGYITSSKDQFGRKTVLDLVDLKERVYPVGRLDYDTSGLLILTNDGDFTFKLSHPSHEIRKTYRAEVIGEPTREEINNFCGGLKIENYFTAPADLKVIGKNNGRAVLEISIHEGRNRQVRKMCEKINHPVIKLERIGVGNLSLGDLKPGEWRRLTKEEIDRLLYS